MSRGRALLRRYAATPVAPRGRGREVCVGETFDLCGASIGEQEPNDDVSGFTDDRSQALPVPLTRGGGGTLIPFPSVSSVDVPRRTLWEDPQALSQDEGPPGVAPWAQVVVFAGGLCAGVILHGAVWTLGWAFLSL